MKGEQSFLTNTDKILKLNLRFDPSALTKHEDTVRKIIDTVKTTGDEALKKFNKEFDNYNGDFKIPITDISIDEELAKSLQIAKSRIAKFHIKEIKATNLKRNWSFSGDLGEKLGVNYKAIDSVAIYVPGGEAALISTVLMTAIPAKVAGVKRIVLFSPPTYAKFNKNAAQALDPAIIYAAKIAGVNEIYAVGGAQAIAAAAYGTESIAPVSKIVGPGNIYVSLAKKQVFGKVGIDGIYGPSELAIVADETANPRHIAADVLSQLEHGSGLESTLVVTLSETSARAIDTAINRAIEDLRTHKSEKQIATIKSSYQNWSAVLVAKDLKEAAELINLYAPEHLELQMRSATKFATLIENAGAIFIGANSCESLGDYLAGPSHCLPTAGSARFSSGLQCADFIKRSSILDFTKVNKVKFKALIKDVARLARAEGLEAHARAMEERDA